VWTGFGVLAYLLFDAVSTLEIDALAWDRGGRWLAGAVIVGAAVYQLTPLKDVCLRNCRGPLSFILGHWRDGRLGALRMGISHGAWCVGCCWALMAALFALGIMSLGWMAVVGAAILVEKMTPVGIAASRVLTAALAIGAVAWAV
jgi:predicted metal-binding membrane protein